MLDAPVARALERPCPQPGAALPRRLLGVGIVAVGDRPALLHLPPVEVDPADRADSKQAAVAIALPSSAFDLAVIGEAGQRLARAAATWIGRAVLQAGLVVLRRIDAAQPYALALQRDGIAIIDDCIARNLACLDPVQPRRNDGQQ